MLRVGNIDLEDWLLDGCCQAKRDRWASVAPVRRQPCLRPTTYSAGAGLRKLCEVRVHNFHLPRERIEKLLHRDSLGLLGLEAPAPGATGKAGQPGRGPTAPP